MRRLTLLAAALALVLASCKPREKIHLVPTKEAVSLASMLHMADAAAAPQLIRGFYPVEQNSWRWTARTFTVVLRPPAGAATAGAQVVANVSFPEILMKKLSPVRLTASVDGKAIGSTSFSAPGEATFTAELPRAAVGDEPVTVDFELDKFLPAGTVETRELGLIANSIGIEQK